MGRARLQRGDVGGHQIVEPVPRVRSADSDQSPSAKLGEGATAHQRVELGAFVLVEELRAHLWEDIGAVEIPRTLLITNDFPPRVGGIQRTLEALCRELPADRISVLAPAASGSAVYDQARSFEVVRGPRRFLWPTPGFAGLIDDEIARTGAEVVVFGDAMPLALLGPRLAERGTPHLILGHGFDYWLSTVPVAHAVMHRMTSRAARVAVCSRFIARRVRTAVPPDVPVSVLYPGADLERFRPDLPTEDLRARLGLDDRPVVVCVSRLVARKGQDVLIRSMRHVLRRVPEASLVIVGGGPREAALRRLAEGAPDGTLIFTGEVPELDLPRYYALGDVFAMPCRTRVGGMEVEGWGNVFIEAAACGRPVVVGDSGGAPETLVHGETGLLVDGRDVAEVADAVATLLEDPAYASRLGKAGRARVEARHTWTRAAQQLSVWLRDAV
jgi:phosphatidylinositol alpha-1,6-mannosyltransferase